MIASYVFCCKILEIFQNACSLEHLQAAACFQSKYIFLKEDSYTHQSPFFRSKTSNVQLNNIYNNLKLTKDSLKCIPYYRKSWKRKNKLITF